MRHLLLLSLTVLWIPQVIAANPGSLVGLTTPPDPEGCSSKAAGMLGSTGAHAYEHLLCNGQDVIVLQRFVERRGKQAVWQVVDELRLPARKSKHVVLDVPVCSSAALKDESVLAVGRWATASDGSLVAKDISSAWRFNLQTQKIEAISVRGVSCESDNPD